MTMFRNEITKEEVEQLEVIRFNGPILLIDSMEKFDREADRIASHTLLGFDTESRPSFKKGRIYPTSLIQLSSHDRAWLVRVGRLGYPDRLLELLSKKEVIKVGSGLNDDLRRMQQDVPFKPAGFLDLQDYVEAFRIGEKGLKKLSAIILGRKISKSQQVSNWDADHLSEAQMRYAATDAWICLEMYRVLRKALSDPHGGENKDHP